MRGSPFCPVAVVSGRQSDWTPRLSRQVREFEQVIMVLYRAEYMVGGTNKVAIESDCMQSAGLGRLAAQDVFPVMG